MKNKMKHIATAAALGVVALLASCVSRQVVVEAESRSDSLELVVSAKDSLINAVFADINAWRRRKPRWSSCARASSGWATR